MGVKRRTPSRPKPPVAADGRVPGRRGLQTRDKLLSWTSRLLEERSYRDLTVIEIARKAGTSPATFYQYFPDVEAAVLVLARVAADEAREIAELVEAGDWKHASKTSLAVVDAFMAFWDRHRALLRVVELATVEGDLRFTNIRTHLLNEITNALRDVVAQFKSARKHPSDLDPMAQAATIVSMLAHVASHRYGFEFWGIRTQAMRRSLGRIVAWSVTGRSPAE